ncbi:DUF3995 domain-containing protein [Blastococcus sp. SYSU D00922]
MTSGPGVVSRRIALPAYGAAVLAGAYAVVSAYWAAGGTALLSTVGGGLEELARSGDAGAVAVGILTVVLKAIGALLALALVRPWGRRLPARLLESAAGVAGAVLVLYGGGLVLVGALALTGWWGAPENVTALRWHVLVWDMWFLVWGVLLLVAAVRRRRLRRGSARQPG